MGKAASVTRGRQIAAILPDDGYCKNQERVRDPKKSGGNYDVPMALVVAMCRFTVMMPVMMVFGIELVVMMWLRAVILRLLVASILGAAINMDVWNVVSGMAVP